MIKEKCLHRKLRNKQKHSKCWFQYDHDKNIDYNDELPFHKSMKRGYRWNSIDTSPIRNFIESKIGCDWNDVYSEIISKTKKKFRWEVESAINYYIMKPQFNDEYLPVLCSNRRWQMYGTKSFVNELFIDLNNKVRKMSEDEIYKEANIYLRRDKLREIMENLKKEQEEENLKNQELSS